MLKPIAIGPSRNAHSILVYRDIASGMHCIRWGSHVKKTTGYKQRCIEKRKAFLRLRERYRRRGKVFVYVDESGFELEASRRYGYSSKGQRVYGLISGHRRPRTSLLAARLAEGFKCPWLFEGTCNTQLFNTWLEHEVCPLLNDTHVVILDNVPFHKSAKTRQLIQACEATLLFLPPYSPDLNPIEHDFANIKKRREYCQDQSLDEVIASYQ
mgnify:CR=1 FL=1